MWRKKQNLPEDVESTIQRLRDERPQATPLELDQIKTTAMSRAGARVRSASTSRRLVGASLVVGLMAAGTGGVIAAGATGGSTGNAASAQYSTATTTVTVTSTSPGGVTIGNNNTCVVVGNGNTITCIIGNGNVIGNGNNSPSTVTVSTVTASSAVLAASTSVTSTAAGGVSANSTTVPAKTTARVSRRFLTISHIGFPTNVKYKTLLVTINGKTYKFKENGKLPVNINFAGLPCPTNGTQVVKITATTAGGKTYHTTRTYRLCVPGPGA